MSAPVRNGPARAAASATPAGGGMARVLAWAAVAASAALLLLPVPAGLPPATVRGAGVVVFAIGLWSTGALPEYLTAIVFFLIAMVFGVAPASVVFSGFHSTAVWLIFGGMVIGLAVARSGLGDRMVRGVLTHVPVGYAGYVAAIALVGLLLAFLVPSAMGRVMLLAPVVLAIADRLGFREGSRGRAGMVLAVGLGTTAPAFAILPSNVPNITLSGAAESIYGIGFGYGDYLGLNFAVMGVLSLAAAIALIAVFFRDRPEPATAPAAAAAWSGGERRLLAILAATLALWMTDFVHGVSPAWVALGAAVLCLMPRVGVVPAKALATEINFGPWLFVAGVIGMGAVATHTGLGEVAGRFLFGLVDLAPGEGPANFAKLVAIGMAVSFVTTHPAAPAIYAPLAGSFADATGWPVASVLMAEVPSWIVFAFPYQAPPVLVALALGGVPVRRVMGMMLAYFAFGVLAILPLHYLWGRALGVFP